MDDKTLSLYRPNVGIALFDRTGQVWIGRRCGAVVSGLGEFRWQMPQGGIDEGETPITAALRELEEEVGTTAVEVLERTPGWLVYDFPPHIRETQSRNWKGQRQVWVAMRFLGSDADINIHTRNPEFDDWRWADLDETPNLIVPFKRDVYRQMAHHFRKFARPA